MKLQTNIFLGYFFVVLTFIVAILFTMLEIDKIKQLSKDITELRNPSSVASSTAYSGVYQSLSSLRGWMLLGNKQFKYNRITSWQQEIKPAIKHLNALSINWTNPENIQRLKKINTLMIQFELYQQEIEDIAQTPANVPSVKLLLTQGVPLADSLYKNLSKIINLEDTQVANVERKKLLKILADTRGSFALILANLRAYLLSGDITFKNKVNALWNNNSLAYTHLQNNTNLLTTKQTEAYNLVASARAKFEPFSRKVLAMRAQNDWNISHHWLATKAAPLAAEIVQLLKLMKDNQIQLLKEDQIGIDNELSTLILIQWLLLILGIVITIIISWVISKNIKKQIGGEPSEIMQLANQVAEGHIKLKGQSHGDTATGILSSLYQIAESNKHLTKQANTISEGDYSVKIVPRSDTDALGIAMQHMAKTLQQITEVAETIAQGDLEVKIESKSNNDSLGLAMQKMTKKLRQTSKENNQTDWLQKGQVLIAESLREESDIETLAESLLKTLSNYVNAQLGTIYQWVDEENTDENNSNSGFLQLIATYAYTRRKHIDQRFNLGESLVGQAAKENKTIIVEQVPEGYIQIRSSMGESIPQNLILIPFSFHGQVRGVLELGFVQEINDQTTTFLASIREAIGAAFENINSQMRLAESLKSSQLLEAEIRTSEQRTSTIIESSLNSIITISTRGIIESCNATAENMFGYSKQEMIGNNVKMLMPESTAVEHDGYLHNYQTTGDAKIIGSGREVVAQRKDGSHFHIHLSVTEMILDDKVSYLGTVSDITEQVETRQKTEALLESISLNEQRTTTILESSLIAMITITKRGIIESCNATTEDYFGYSKQEMIGNNVKMLMPESRAVEHDGYLKNYQDTGIAKIIGSGREVVAKRKDGSEFPIFLSVSEMKLGDTLNYLGTISDITEQVAQREKVNQANMELQANTEELASQQEELRQTNETLNNKTQELEKQKKDLQISQQELENKAKELTESSRYKSEFLANMSHELRTPLNSLLILAKFLADNDAGNLSEDEIESATVIHESGSNLLQLINDILDLSKVESGHMSIHKDAIVLSDLHLFIESRFKHMAEAKDISFKIQTEPNTPDSFISDYTKLGQILTNLISNAIKFTEKGSVILNISLQEEQKTDQSGTLAFTVIDTGIGIPIDKQQAVFEAFQQADGATNRQYGGTGLGLSIALSFSKLLSGKIVLVSEADKGSQFTLTIPYIKPSIDQKADPELNKIVAQRLEPIQVKLKDTPPPCKDDRDQLDPEKPLFLLIEDDALFAKNLLKICHQQNSQILLAPDGETGLNLAKQYSLTGIILDYMLPGLDGGDVLAVLQSDTATRHIPVHIISAVDDLIDLQQLGAKGQLTKPISKNQIISVLDLLHQEHDLQEVTVLVIEDDDSGIAALKKLLGKEAIKVSYVKTGADAIKALKQQQYSSIILDLGLPDMTGFELLKQLSEDKDLVMPTVIVYSGKDLTDAEHQQLQEFTSSIVIKSVKSPERLLDEIHLFIDNVTTAKAQDVKPIPQQTNLEKLTGKNILLVDDDMRNTFSLAKVLRSKGLEVRIAPSGQDGLTALDQQTDFDMVLMDIMMPEMDGYETMRRIRAQEKFKDLPIIALTANAMRGDKEKCIVAGANDYLAKPVDVDKLLLQMQLWL